MDKKIKMPPKRGFPPFVTENRALVTFVTLWCPKLMQKRRKNLIFYRDIFKWTGKPTDGPRTDRVEYIGVFQKRAKKGKKI